MTLRNLTDALAACEIPTPKAAAAWLAIRDAVRDSATAHQIQQPDQVIDDLTPKNAAEHVDRLVRQRLEVDERRAVVSQLAATAEGRAARAIQADADKILAEYRARFDTAAQTIAANAAAFSPDDEAEAVLNRGADAATAWTAIAHASATLDAAAMLWSTLYEQPLSADAVVASFDGDHWRRIDAQSALENSRSRWHALVAAGYTLRFNTWTEAQTLIAATPARALRVESTSANGFRSLEQVRA